MSKTIPINRKLTDFHNKENISQPNSYQHKKSFNNFKYNNNYPIKDPSLPLNTNIANQILESFHDNNYAHNLFNETENFKNLHENGTNSNVNTNVNINNSSLINNNNISMNTKPNNNENINNVIDINNINDIANKDKYITINDIIGEKCEINLDILNLFFNNFDPSKTSRKNMGVIKSYGVNTYQGIVRNYNEDRVSIIINMNKPKDYAKGRWPKISFFGIYDGHGGEGCSEYLRDNLHKLICSNEYFPENIPEAIKFGISKAEEDFINNYALAKNKEEIIDKSGSCAIIILIVDTNIYISNVGDSRCLLSMNNGNNYVEVTKDHKPNSPNEMIRIKKNGGSIYQSQTVINNTENNELNGKILIGPYRVLPGRLSVCRTIGDAEAKLVKFGGNPNVIISEPEIFYYDLKKDNLDFFILGCDGIYDQMSNKEVLDCAWMILNEKNHILINECKNLHNQSGFIVDLILKASLARKSFDNVTCLFIALKDLGIKQLDESESIFKKKEKITQNVEDTSDDTGITQQKVIPNFSQDIPVDKNRRKNFEKIYTIKKKSNALSKKTLNDISNEETKCKTNRNDSRFHLISNNRFSNHNNNNKIYNTDYKLNTLKLNNTENKKYRENTINHHVSMKNFGFDKNKKDNRFHKIQTKQNLHKENNPINNSINNNNNDNYLSHNRLPTNVVAYSKKNQSFTKINKYLINLNSSNNANNSNYKQKRNMFNNYPSYATKKISEGNINHNIDIKKIMDKSDINNDKINNSHIYKPTTKFNFNQPLKVIESKNSFTSSTKNLSMTNKSSIILNNINNLNRNTNNINHAKTKSHRYLMANKDMRNSAFISYNNNKSTYNINNSKINNTFNEIPLNDKYKRNYVNLNEQYKYQSQLMNNTNNNHNLSSFTSQNQRKQKTQLSLNGPEGNSASLSNNYNNYIANKNLNNVLSTRIKRDLTSKIRQMSMQKSSIPTNNYKLSHPITGINTTHNISMQNIQLNNNLIHNYNYGDRNNKAKNYKLNGEKNYQNKNNSTIKYNSYLMTDLGKSKKGILYEDNKKNNMY